jgi:hypothetical protein
VIALPDEPDIAALLAARDAAEAEASEVASEDPADSVIALCSALSELTSRLFSAVNGERAEAEGFHMEAALASADAFPLGTSESAAFGVLLDYASSVLTGAAP